MMTTQEPLNAPLSVPSASGEEHIPLAHLIHGQPGWKAVTVEHLDGERYAVGVRGHLITVDQPLADGGTDTAPTPTELFVSALASCVAFYAGRFLDRHGLNRRGLSVTASFAMATDRPARIASMTLSVSAPTLPENRRDAFLAVVNHCTVHNTLHQVPDIDISIT
jgi:putative redox protein